MTEDTGRQVHRIAATGGLRTAFLASAAAILPIAALSAPPAPAAAQPRASFAPTGEAMVLTRTLRRPLPGGAVVATARSYEIRFVRVPGGYRIDGDLIDVKVDVPSTFEALAAMERARPDTGLFPVRIDNRGRFVSAGEERPKAFAHEASKLALAQVPAGLARGEAREARSFIEQVGSNPVHTAWPDDLFMPAPGRRSDRHVVPLPGGKTSEVAIEIEASVDAISGILSRLTRNVTTRLGDSSRITEETWTLAHKD